MQDVASKGLALVYESGDEMSRSTLVGVLVDQLTVGRRSVAQVSKDTKLFEEGSLGKAPTGYGIHFYSYCTVLLIQINGGLNQTEKAPKVLEI